MPKRICIVCILLSCLFLTGCVYTVDAHRVWVLCKVEGKSQYYYNDLGEYVKVTDGVMYAHGGAGLSQLPALYFEPEDYTPHFEYVLPGHFKGTLRSVAGYVNIIAVSYEVTYSDPYMLEIYANTEDDVIRIIFKASGDIQMYAKSGNVPPDLSTYVMQE